MRTRILAAIVGALITAAALYAYLRAQQPAHVAVDLRRVSEAPNPRVAEQATGHVALPSTPAPKASHDAAPVARIFEGVRNFEQLIQKVDAAGNNADALKAKMDAAGFCEMKDVELDEGFARRKKQRGASSEAEASFEAYKAYRRRFCVGWNGESLGATASEMIDLDPSNDLNTSQQIAQDDDKERATAMALDLFRNSRSDTAIRNAAIYLSNAGPDAWPDGKEVVQGTYLANQLPRIQMLAANMIACEVGGGCGGDGFYAWSECQSYDLCHAGVSMDEIWRKASPPDVYDAARRMAALMRRPSS